MPHTSSFTPTQAHLTPHNLSHSPPCSIPRPLPPLPWLSSAHVFEQCAGVRAHSPPSSVHNGAECIQAGGETERRAAGGGGEIPNSSPPFQS